MSILPNLRRENQQLASQIFLDTRLYKALLLSTQLQYETAFRRDE